MHGIVKEPLVTEGSFSDMGRMVIALGNFDGVHIGHSAIIARTVSLARELSVNAGVWMFDPHPMVCLTGRSQPLLTTLAERKYEAKQPAEAIKRLTRYFNVYLPKEAEKAYLCTAHASHHMHTPIFDTVVPNNTA